MKGVQCYELFGGIALKIHTISFSFFSVTTTPSTTVTPSAPTTKATTYES